MLSAPSLKLGLYQGAGIDSNFRGRFTRRSVRALAETKGEKENKENRSNEGFGSIFSNLTKSASPGGTQVLSPFSKSGPSSSGGFLSFLAPKEAGGTRGMSRPNADTVFVAGGTGRLGLRVVYELAAAGFRVRAGVRSADKAETLLDRLTELSETLGPLSRQQISRINTVYCDLEEPESIIPAIGNASKVVCAVGSAENGLTDFSAPQRIDYRATEDLIETTANLGTVDQFILITSLGTGKFGWPVGLLNLAGGVLYWKRQAEEALERSGLSYLIIRPGGMERPKDNFKEKNNAKLAPRDTFFGGQVSRLQVAELVATALLSPDVAENKVVEIVAESKAPMMDYESLLSSLPTEIPQESRLEALELTRESRVALVAAREELSVATAQLKELREAIAEASEKVAKTRADALAVEKEQSAIIKDARRAEAELQKLREDAEEKALLEAAAKAVVKEGQRAQREGRILSNEEVSAIRKPILNPPKTVSEEEESAEMQPVQNIVNVFTSGGTQAKRDKAAAAQRADKSPKHETEDTKPEGAVPRASIFDAFMKPPTSPETKKDEGSVVEQEESPASVESEQASSQRQGEKSASQSIGIFSGISNFFQPQGTVYIDELEQPQSQPEEVQGAVEPRKTRPSVRDMKNVSKVQDVETSKDERGSAEQTASQETEGVTTEASPQEENPLDSLFSGFRMPWDQEEQDDASLAAETEKYADTETPATAGATMENEATATSMSECSPTDNAAEARAWIEAWRARTGKTV